MGVQIFSQKVWDRYRKSMGKVWDFGKKSLKHIKGAYKRNSANLFVNIMIYASPTLSTAYFYKEDFLKILDSDNRESAKKAMSDWINSALDCGIPHIVKCAQTMINWLSGILNSFSVSITNGFTEGCNNKIKVLKRNAYGYQNFKRFRNRILHMYSHQHSNKIVKQATA